MKYLLLLISLLAITKLGQAQDLLLGRVLDSENKKPIADVLVRVLESGDTIVSNSLGYFQFKADSGNHLVFSKEEYFESNLLMIEQKNILLTLQKSTQEVPIYYSGMTQFYKHLAKSIRYPNQARRMGIEGKCLVSFDIDTLGQVGNIQILESILNEVDVELIRVLNELPELWIPSSTNYNLVLPVTFRLGDNNQKFESSYDLSGRNMLTEIVITAFGVSKGSSSSQNFSMVNSLSNVNTPKDVSYSIHGAIDNKDKTKLVLSNQYLRKLPKSIGELEHISYLDLENNKISSIPIEIKLLLNLEEVYATSNKIADLPFEFSSLKKLKILGLAYNKLEFIPEPIYYLENLEMLDLGDNKISIVSKDIGELKNLKVLVLSNNKIATLPESINQLSRLEKLDLRGNNISLREIEQLKKSLRDTEIIYK
ncbi:MAG: TonB family protein [Reichenbachiella sp.]|uniref:TonB family protein n=1 Tax=Reichenbachiella sp. TaxID=2184521 RepID=UPI0032656587